MARWRTLRGRRYWDLRLKFHFAPVEAREFSRLQRKYPALKVMVRHRAGMWRTHENKARARGWSPYKTQREWVDTLKQFYSQERYKLKKDRATGLSELVLRNWIVRRDVHGAPIRAKPSVWEWYDEVFNSLPDELKWDTPRGHRTKRDGQGEVKLDRVRTQRWVADLRKSMSRTSDPDARERYRVQIENLRRGLRGKR